MAELHPCPSSTQLASLSLCTRAVSFFPKP
ncbi:hypothetical protein Zm00014a_004286 [Zea mays]|uniref:Uncharacterized protein n=1 Tax=Zea mays TaxID=4577 RepID=A0A3L6EFL7_MAIZE|nr:hypothetical protein Zm00014a_004286 [Zea mays]